MDYQVLNLLLRSSKEFNHKVIRDHDFNETEVIICSYIYSHPGLPQDALAYALKTDKTTIAKALLRLERDNCIVRTVEEKDRRVRLVNLTPSGREKISELLDVHNDWLRQIMGCLTEEEQSRFVDYCKRLLKEASTINDSMADERKAKKSKGRKVYKNYIGQFITKGKDQK